MSPFRPTGASFGALVLATLLCACTQTPAPSQQQASDNGAAARKAKAIADGAQAARALARSMGVQTTPEKTDADGATPAEKPDSEGYVELDWLKMMPKEDLEALKNEPAVQHVGSARMKQFGTYHTVEAVTQRKIKLPGYVVPIESDDQGRMTEFFFVPFFGACIHVPPPPPNQIVYARLAKPIKTPEIWDPYWLRGELRIETRQNKLAGSAYTMSDASLVPYDG